VLTEPAATVAGAGPSRAHCRFCGAGLEHTFADLGMSPLCETILSPGELNRMEPFYPLHVWVCAECLLVQVEDYVAPEAIFHSAYPYHSSYSTSWLRHAETYVEQMCQRLSLGTHSQVVEIGSNDGYLLQYFVGRGIPVLGIEPAGNVAEEAERRGVPTRTRFFGEDMARELVEEVGRADLLLGNNVLAQVPDLNSFLSGASLLLAPDGLLTMEFPHLLRLVERNQFDTIYHEHFSYFSLLAVERIFSAHGLQIFDVEELSSHGGSLRVFARHIGHPSQPVRPAVGALRAAEEAAGLRTVAYYTAFNEQARSTKRRLLRFLVDAKDAGRTIVGYGAPGKGNTLLNYCGIGRDFLDYTVDRNPHKQGGFLPGTHIPILDPGTIEATRPDLVLILPWNLSREIMEQMRHIHDWGGKFVVAIPDVAVHG